MELSDLTFVKHIASGLVGQVDQYQNLDGSLFAKKTFSPLPTLEQSKVDILRKRFIREIKIQSNLPENLFIPILNFDSDSDEPWYLMPFADKTLADLVFPNQQQPPPQDVLFDILNSLEHLHDHGFAHRDLKPPNILFHNGNWKLSDFGFVKTEDGTEQLTSHSGAWGSEYYCAPEQLERFKDANNKSDIYSFGCILHDFASDIRRIPYRKHTCYGDFTSIVEKCTETNPANRFDNISDIRESLGIIYSLTTQNDSVLDDESPWPSKVKNIRNWSEQDFRDFLSNFERESGCSSYGEILFSPISETDLNYLYQLDFDCWNALCNHYCEWAKRESFDFNFCDVLVGKLEFIYRNGDISLKSKSVISIAELAAKHNRWFVMNRLIPLCDEKINEPLARRIAIDISIENCAGNFVRCASGVNKNTSSYHPLIASLIDKR